MAIWKQSISFWVNDMNVKIYPSKASGNVSAPPSKSMAHRALICGALTDGSKISNIAFSEDISATINCLQSLGAKVEINGNEVAIGGFDPEAVQENTELYCNESGSTLRFLIPICLLSGKRITLKGKTRLFERPLSVYESICNEQGIFFEKSADSITLCGKLKSGNYRVRGDVSSQFITGLLYTLPLLDGISIIEVVGKFESASYIDLTLSALSDFGIKITRVGSRFIIMGIQSFKARNYTVEGDCSNAAFLDALNFAGGDVNVKGINENTLQGDRVYKKMLNDLSRGVTQFDLSDCPDLAPIMFAMSAVKSGARFEGTRRLRIKESDRASAMAQELFKFGIPVTVGDDYVIVGNAELKKPTELLCGHNDHRIVMSLAVLSTLVGGEIEGAETVNKSYPEFFSVLESLNIGLETK